MTILTMARYEWFEEWAGTRAKHRGPDYQRYKLAIAQRLLERALQRFPHLRDKVTGCPHGVPRHVGCPAGRAHGGDRVFCRDGGGVVGMESPGVLWGWGTSSVVGCPTGMGAQWKWGAQWGLGGLWSWGAQQGWGARWE